MTFAPFWWCFARELHPPVPWKPWRVESSFGFQDSAIGRSRVEDVVGGRRLPAKRRNASEEARRRGDQQLHPLKQLKSMLLERGLRRPQKLTEDHILSLLFARRARDAVFGKDLFSDPAYDILLELYAAKLGERSMSLQEIAQAIETPTSTTRRWVAALEHRGLAESAVDQSDPARVLISLTPDGATKLEHLLNHWSSAFLSI